MSTPCVHCQHQQPVQSVGGLFDSFGSFLGGVGDFFTKSGVGQAIMKIGVGLGTAALTSAVIGQPRRNDPNTGFAYVNPANAALLGGIIPQQPQVIVLQQPGAAASQPLPEWAVPAMIGAGALVLVLALRK